MSEPYADGNGPKTLRTETPKIRDFRIEHLIAYAGVLADRDLRRRAICEAQRLRLYYHGVLKADTLGKALASTWY